MSNDDDKLDPPMVHGIKCPRCGDRIWSRFGHDFHYCKCGYSFVDGGRHYLRFGWGDPFSGEVTHGQPKQIIIDSSDHTQYDD